MTIKLVVLKSGEDIIADVTEMAVGEDDNRRIVGYFLEKPCNVKMRNPNVLGNEKEGNTQKAGYEVSLFPWMPLAKEGRIPIPADWLVTMVEPVDKLQEMYLEDVVNYGKVNKDTSTDKSADNNK